MTGKSSIRTPMYPEKIGWLENARVLAILSVIVVHVAGPAVYSKSPLTETEWLAASFFEAIRFGRPAFIMISGALFLQAQTINRAFFKRRFYKIILPFLFFSLLYSAATFGAGRILSEGISLQLVVHIYNSLLNGAFYHLWYIYLLIALYIITPLLQFLIHRLGKRGIEYLLLVWLLFITVYGYGLLNIPANGVLNFLGYTGYYILGHYLFNYCKGSKLLGISMLLTGLAVTFWFSYNNKTTAFYELNTLNIFLQGCGFFVFMKAAHLKNDKLLNSRNFINRYSYTIYLLHPLILVIMIRCGITWNFAGPFMGIIISVAVCLLISLFTAFILKKIPVVKHFT